MCLPDFMKDNPLSKERRQNMYFNAFKQQNCTKQQLKQGDPKKLKDHTSQCNHHGRKK